MEVTADNVAVAGTIINTGLIGVIWHQLIARLDKLETGKTTKEHCILRSQIMDERFENIKLNLSNIHNNNKDNYDKLYVMMEDVHDVLGGIQECVTKLSAGVDCT